MSLLEQECEEYLASLGSTLWGQGFDVIDPKGRKRAAAWLAEQIRGVKGGLLAEHTDEKEQTKGRWVQDASGMFGRATWEPAEDAERRAALARAERNVRRLIEGQVTGGSAIVTAGRVIDTMREYQASLSGGGADHDR